MNECGAQKSEDNAGASGKTFASRPTQIMISPLVSKVKRFPLWPFLSWNRLLTESGDHTHEADTMQLAAKRIACQLI